MSPPDGRSRWVTPTRAAGDRQAEDDSAAAGPPGITPTVARHAGRTDPTEAPGARVTLAAVSHQHEQRDDSGPRPLKGSAAVTPRPPSPASRPISPRDEIGFTFRGDAGCPGQNGGRGSDASHLAE